MNISRKIWQVASLVSTLALLCGMQASQADSVAQVQTTKYFAPETVAMIKQRVTDVANHVPGATLGFRAGDTVSYIIQFTPIANTSTVGAGGYITDYIPAGVSVTAASFVQPDGAGGFYPVAPPTSAQMATDNALGAFTGWTMDATTLATCTAAGRTAANCTGRFANLVADTGIFYSTDPRTAVFTDPSTDGRVRQWGSAVGGNGYYIFPARGGTQLPPKMGAPAGALPTTHNYWDAAMTTAFGTATAQAVTSPTATNTRVVGVGTGPAPYNAASPVAGPDTGYKLDYTGSVGPWQRISYLGSTIGPTGLPATGAAGANSVVGTSTSAGASFPLPGNTNAVRWAAGRLVVGTQSYVKISLVLGSAPPAAGLVNNSEVFGGDGSPESGMAAAPGGNGNVDNPWSYHVPSVASNVSSLFVLKEVVCVYDASNTCVANNGANLPLVAPATTIKVRYRINYINTNNGTQHNSVVCDQLPNTTTAVTFATQVTQISATPNIGVPTSPAIAACGFGAGGTTFSYPAIPVMAGGAAGILEFDVVLTPGTATSVTNTAKIVSTEIPTGVTSFTPSNITSTQVAKLLVTKTVSPANANDGDTVTYNINIVNTGTVAGGLTSLSDTLPGVATATVPSQILSRFNYVSTSSMTLNGTPLSGVSAIVTPPPTPATANNETVNWNFPSGTDIPAGGILNLVFTASAGGNNTATNLMVFGTAYSNTATATYTGGALPTSTSGATAPVTLTIPNLQVLKTIDCVFVGATCAAGSYVAGSSIPPSAKLRYKIVYTNPEAAPQTITLTDTLPASTTAAGNLYVENGPDIRPNTSIPVLSVNPAAAGSGRGADAVLTTIAASSVVTFTATSLPAKSSGTLYMDVQTNAAALAVVTNSASISSTQRTAAGGAVIPPSSVSATASALTITKTSNVATVAPGGNVIYTITVTNPPTGVATALTTVVDTLPKPLPNTAGSTIQCGTTAPTCLATTAVTINGVAAAAPTLVQTAATATVGQINTWTLAGAAAARTVNPGQTMVLTFTATLSTTVPRGNTYSNTATINYTGGSSATGPTAPVNVPYNTLSLSKAVLSPASASIAPNSPVTYAITVTNTGTTDAPVTSVVDSLPAATVGTIAFTSPTTSVLVNGVAQTGVAGAPAANQYTNPAPAAAVAGTQQVVTWTFPASTVINPGQAMVITFVAQFGVIPLGTTYFNDVVVNFTGGLLANVNAPNQSPVTVPVISKITKTIDCIYNPSCVAGSYVDGTPIPVNAKLGYKIVYENLSATPASGITISDILPTQIVLAPNPISNLVINGVATAAPAAVANPAATTLFTAGTLTAANTPGSTGTITFAVQTTATSGAGVTNTGKMVSTQDTIGVTGLATAQAAGANLTITKAVTPATSSTVAQGGTASYTITVVNDGVADAILTNVTDTLPRPTAGTITCAVAATCTTSINLNGTPLAITPTLTAATATVGQIVTWTFAGPNNLLPAGARLTITFNASYSALVPKGAAAPGQTYYNSVATTYTGGAFGSASASGQAPVLVPFNTLTMSKTIDCVYTGVICTAGSYVAGSPIPVNAKLGYKLSYTNLSPIANTAVAVNDILPTQVAANAISNMTVNGVATAAPTNLAGGGTVALVTGATLAAVNAIGSTGTITFALQTNATSGALVSNTGSITSTQQATAVTDNVSAVVLDTAQLVISKSTGTPNLALGNRATYTITIQNTGGTATSALKVLDFLPFDGATSDITKRLNYVTTTGYTLNGGATVLTPTITTSSPPTVSPYGSNSNQQQVQWDFGAYVLGAGSSLTITFTADSGINMTSGVIYTNTAQTQFISNGVTIVTTVSNTAPIKLIPRITVSKSIIAVCSGVGCTPTPYTVGTVIPVNAKIRYQIVYTNPSAVDAQTNIVLRDVLPTQTATAPVSNVVIVSGLITAPSAPTLAGLSGSGATLTFPTLASLPASGTGTITLDVQSTVPIASTVINTVKVVSAEDAVGVTNSASASTTSLIISKSIIAVCSGAGCTPASYTPGAVIPTNAKVRYQIVYSNASATTAQTNVVLSDILPTQTAAAPVSNVVIVSGAITVPSTPTLAGLAAGGATLSFPTLASLPASGTGTITLDVQTNGTTAASVSNTGKLMSMEDTVGVTSTAAANVTSLTVSKSIIAVCSGASCIPTAYVIGSEIPVNAKVRYQIIYNNASTVSAQSNVVLSDILPTQTAAASVSNVVIVSGAITAPSAPTLAGLAAGGATLTFPTLASLPASGAGTITLDVQTTAPVANTVNNTAKLVSTEDTVGVTGIATATTSVISMSKTTSTANVAVNGTATYTITIVNNGTSPTTSLKVYDYLPYSGTTADATKRFSYISTTGYTGGLPVPTITPTVAPTISPYISNTNQQQVLWNFGAFALPAGATATITFTATVGGAMPAGSYTNSAGYQYTTATGSGTMNTNGFAAISVTNLPSLTFTKLVDIVSDPVNGTTNPKFIPGAVAVYTIIASNASGSADNNSIVITDHGPANTELYVADIGVPGSGPLLFIQGAPSSGLTYSYAAPLNNPANDVSFSNDNGVTWTALPVAGTNGCDPLITNLRINPKNIFVGNPTPPHPSFTLKFRVCVK